MKLKYSFFFYFFIYIKYLTSFFHLPWFDPFANILCYLTSDLPDKIETDRWDWILKKCMSLKLYTNENFEDLPENMLQLRLKIVHSRSSNKELKTPKHLSKKWLNLRHFISSWVNLIDYFWHSIYSSDFQNVKCTWNCLLVKIHFWKTGPSCSELKIQGASI